MSLYQRITGSRYFNKYVIALVLFALVMLFLDSFSVFKLFERKADLKDLKKQEQFYKDEIQRIEEDSKAFENDTEQLEKFAREEYQMKKDDEEVFVIVEEEDN